MFKAVLRRREGHSTAGGRLSRYSAGQRRGVKWRPGCIKSARVHGQYPVAKMRLRALERLYGPLGVTQAVLAVLSAIVAGLLKASPPDVKQHLGDNAAGVVIWFQTQAYWTVPSMVLVVGILQLVRTRLGNPRQWKVVQFALDQFRSRIFDDVRDARDNQHRVTLFKRVRWCWCFRKYPWSGWLVPVARSGYTSQHSSSIFRAKESGDDVEGGRRSSLG